MGRAAVDHAAAGTAPEPLVKAAGAHTAAVNADGEGAIGPSPVVDTFADLPVEHRTAAAEPRKVGDQNVVVDSNVRPRDGGEGRGRGTRNEVTVPRALALFDANTNHEKSMKKFENRVRDKERTLFFSASPYINFKRRNVYTSLQPIKRERKKNEKKINKEKKKTKTISSIFLPSHGALSRDLSSS